MEYTDWQLDFLTRNHTAAMTSFRKDGSVHVVRVGVRLVDGKLWSTCTADRLRTKHLRRDPRSTVTVFDPGHGYLTIDANVRIIDGEEGAQANLALTRAGQADSKSPPTDGTVNWMGKAMTEDEYLQSMRDLQRLVFEFEPIRAHGMD